MTADLRSESCWDGLSALGLDVALVGEALLGEHFELAELTAEMELVHGRAVIVNSMEISPDWRGAEYGLLATELALRELGRCADVAALYPMQPDLADLDERAAAESRPVAVWGPVGFVDFNGIMALAPASVVGPRQRSTVVESALPMGAVMSESLNVQQRAIQG